MVNCGPPEPPSPSDASPQHVSFGSQISSRGKGLKMPPGTQPPPDPGPPPVDDDEELLDDAVPDDELLEDELDE